MSEAPIRSRVAGFTTTRWSLVLAAGASGTAARRRPARSAEALATLCDLYWYPAYAFIRRQGYRSEECADLTQAFFTSVIEKNFFQGLDPSRGRFRAYLCASLRHFLANERDRAHALKRGGGQRPISLDLEAAEGRYHLEPADRLTPEKLFDRRWALMLLERVLAELRQEHEAAGKLRLFEHLKGYLTFDDHGIPYTEPARALRMSEGAVKVAVHRLRRRFRDLLVAEISETVADAEDVQSEIAHLLRAVST
jgi:RNA polymerase sigma factor (sigma-70 family)